MTEKLKETPKEELECPKKYVYDTGIIFECKDSIRVQIIGEDVADLLNLLSEENEQLKKQKEHLERKIERERTSAMKEHEKWEKEVIELIREQRKFIDDLSKENEQLKSELNIKDDLIQQLQNTLNIDQYREANEYREKFGRVCTELADMNKDYKKLSEENEELREALKDCTKKAKEEIRKEKEEMAIRWANIGR